MKLKEFKNEFRMLSIDTWGDAMEAWFEAVGHLYDRGEGIPSKYQYVPNGGGSDPDSVWCEYFNNTSTKELYDIAEFMFRYCSFLKFCGKDY